VSSHLELSAHVEEWAAKIPFRITNHQWDAFKVVVVELTDGVHVGRGEAVPVYYLETFDSVCRQIEIAGREVARGVGHEDLLGLLPAGAARNAIDCALWDLEAESQGKSIWELTGIRCNPATSTFTIGIEETAQLMALRAQEAAVYPILKIKVDHREPVSRVAAIRAARPDARLTVDANQGWTYEQLQEVSPQLADLGVKLIEQPLPRGRDEILENYRSVVPLCADESCQHRGELKQAMRRYQIINIKLDKAGGLTEALLLAKAVTDGGLQALVSNMWGTSLAMAPAFVVAQLCQYVELDGPLLLRQDRVFGLQFKSGNLSSLDPRLWG
jgi:L-alanine-DL-glutamate epimerase-like enolase superfamily enzyme